MGNGLRTRRHRVSITGLGESRRLTSCRKLWLTFQVIRSRRNHIICVPVYDWKLILSDIAMVFSKQDHLGLPSQGLLRNIEWTLLSSCACLPLSLLFCRPKDITDHYVQLCHHYRFMREINDSFDGFKNAEALNRCFPRNIIPSPTPKPDLSQTPSSSETTNPRTEKTYFLKFHVTYHCNIHSSNKFIIVFNIHLLKGKVSFMENVTSLIIKKGVQKLMDGKPCPQSRTVLINHFSNTAE